MLTVFSTWQFFTTAKVTKPFNHGGTNAFLTKNGIIMRVNVLSPPGAKFERMSCNPSKLGLGDDPNLEYTKLVVRLPRMVTNVTVAVQFQLMGRYLRPGHLPIKPITSWPGFLS
jgi:hypothetical protein